MPRVKAFSRGKFTSVYTPNGPWEEWATRVKFTCGGAPVPAFEGPVALTMNFVMPEPKSLAKSRRGTAHRSRPDIDNLVKLVMDRLQERGWFRDDGQICSLTATKQYGAIPGLKLEIHTDEDYAG